QTGEIRAGLERTKACWPCQGMQHTSSGPGSWLSPGAAASLRPSGGPTPWIHYEQTPEQIAQAAQVFQTVAPPNQGGHGAPGVSSSFWQQFAAGAVPGATPGGPAITSTASPAQSITGPGGSAVHISPSGQTSLVPIPSPGGSSGGSLPPVGPGGSSGQASPSAGSPGPVTGVLSGLFGSPWIVIGGLVLIYFLFLRK